MKNKIMFLLTIVAQMILMSVPVFGQVPNVKKSTAKKHSLLIVLCHADDYISIAPLIPKYAAEGHSVHYLALTGRMDSTEMVEGGTKYAQMLCATAALGFRDATAFVDFNEGMRSVGWHARHIIEAID